VVVVFSLEEEPGFPFSRCAVVGAERLLMGCADVECAESVERGRFISTVTEEEEEEDDDDEDESVIIWD